MKGIVLILFIGLMAYEALSLMQIISPTVDEAQRVSKTKSLSKKVLVPEGMKAEYSLIFNKNINPINKRMIGSKGKGTAKHVAYVSTEKEKKVSPVKQESKNEQKSVNVMDGKIYVNLKNYMVQKDHLVGDVLLYNNTSKDKKGIVSVTCEFVDKNGEVVDEVTWRGRVELMVKKAVKVKSVDFGYVNAMNYEKVSCSVSSMRY